MRAPLCHRGVAFVLLASGLALVGRAQEPEIKQKFIQAQQLNTAALRQYTWKSRTELKLKGETKKVKLEQVSYDAQGQQQKTELDSQQEQQEVGGRGPGRRLRRKIIEKKKEEFAELMQDLVRLATSYSHVPPQRLQAFVKSAQFNLGQAPYEGTVRISGQNALQPGDAMRIWIQKDTLMVRRIEIDTALDQKPVRIVSDYQDLPQGPTYQSHATLEHSGEAAPDTHRQFSAPPGRSLRRRTTGVE